MKIYIITYRNCNCEGMVEGFPKIYKVFINKRNAEKAMDEAEKTFGWTRCAWKIEEKEIEEAE